MQGGAQAPWRKIEGGIFGKCQLLSLVYPSANTEIVEGRPIGNKARLSPLLTRLQGEDKDGMSVSGEFIGGGKGVQRAFPSE